MGAIRVWLVARLVGGSGRYPVCHACRARRLGRWAAASTAPPRSAGRGHLDVDHGADRGGQRASGTAASPGTRPAGGGAGRPGGWTAGAVQTTTHHDHAGRRRSRREAARVGAAGCWSGCQRGKLVRMRRSGPRLRGSGPSWGSTRAHRRVAGPGDPGAFGANPALLVMRPGTARRPGHARCGHIGRPAHVVDPTPCRPYDRTDESREAGSRDLCGWWRGGALGSSLPRIGQQSVNPSARQCRQARMIGLRLS
jgi:hypothetical protein